MFDYIFITHLPSFYKVNLYNELAKHKKIFVIFISSGSAIRPADFASENYGFDYKIINSGSFESRKLYLSSIKVMKTLWGMKSKKIVVNGWDLVEFWFAIFFRVSSRKCLALESSIFDSKTSGLKQVIKQIFLKKISCVYASGLPHSRLLKELGYSGQLELTSGVGLINTDTVKLKKSTSKFTGEFLYVGRLSAEKNIDYIFDYFRKHNNFKLNIVGDGPLLAELKDKAPANVAFLGYINNVELGKIYIKNDIFVLPSTSEPWGLVVEEAISFGLPILCSNKVGCSEDLVMKHECGVVFAIDDATDFDRSADLLIEKYNFYHNNVASFDERLWCNSQISAYLE